MADVQDPAYLAGYTAKWQFSVVPGVFRDFTDEDRPDGKLPTQPRLALVHQDYPPAAGGAAAATNGVTNGVANGTNGVSETDYTQDWPRFAEYVRSLNKQAPEGVRYKVLYMTRHGVGYHNQKSVEVGVEAWDVRFTHSLLFSHTD